jgi:hypothetical protein
MPDNQPTYAQEPCMYVYQVTLTANQVLRNQKVPIDLDSDFMLTGIHGTQTGGWNSEPADRYRPVTHLSRRQCRTRPRHSGHKRSREHCRDLFHRHSAISGCSVEARSREPALVSPHRD